MFISSDISNTFTTNVMYYVNRIDMYHCMNTVSHISVLLFILC